MINAVTSLRSSPTQHNVSNTSAATAAGARRRHRDHPIVSDSPSPAGLGGALGKGLDGGGNATPKAQERGQLRIATPGIRCPWLRAATSPFVDAGKPGRKREYVWEHLQLQSRSQGTPAARTRLLRTLRSTSQPLRTPCGPGVQLPLAQAKRVNSAEQSDARSPPEPPIRFTPIYQFKVIQMTDGVCSPSRGPETRDRMAGRLQYHSMPPHALQPPTDAT